jgi:hypothetical protein
MAATALPGRTESQPAKMAATADRVETAARAAMPEMVATQDRLDSCCSGIRREGTDLVAPAAVAVTLVRRDPADRVLPEIRTRLMVGMVEMVATLVRLVPAVTAGASGTVEVGATGVSTELPVSRSSARQEMGGTAALVPEEQWLPVPAARVGVAATAVSRAMGARAASAVKVGPAD